MSENVNQGIEKEARKFNYEYRRGKIRSKLIIKNQNIEKEMTQINIELPSTFYPL